MWGDIYAHFGLARKALRPKERIKPAVPVVVAVRERFGIDLRNIRVLNRFLRGLYQQGTAMAGSARSIHLQDEYDITPEAAERLAALVERVWYSFLLEIFRAEMLPFIGQPSVVRFWRSRIPGPRPDKLRWAALAPTAAQVAVYEVVMLAESDESEKVSDEAWAILLERYADGLAAFTNLAAGIIIAETAVTLLQPEDGVPQEVAEYWRDLIIVTNLCSLPDRWHNLIQPNQP